MRLLGCPAQAGSPRPHGVCLSLSGGIFPTCRSRGREGGELLYHARRTWSSSTQPYQNRCRDVDFSQGRRV